MERHAHPHALVLWSEGRAVATLGHDPKADLWSLDYDPDWVAWPDAFPLSPALPFVPTAAGYPAGAVKRFIENLLPEGHALDIAANAHHLSKSNIFGLIHALGVETTGAFSFLPPGEAVQATARAKPREITRDELDRRLVEREFTPLAIWDGRVRMSIAGVQDKVMVYLDRPLAEGGRMFLVEPPLASTHILKPEVAKAATPHLVVNEHYCMSLARRMGLPAAEVAIFRTPKPVLVVERFDRVRDEQQTTTAGLAAVHRLHIIDACQAADLPASYKYERLFGSGEHVRDIREGMSFERLFEGLASTINKAAARLTLLRWALFQFLIGNSDAHGKNFSFFVHGQGLEPAPWYDLVSVVQYPRIDHELAMAYGDAFSFDEVTPFAWADFASRCQLDRRLLLREATRLARLVSLHAPAQAAAIDYLDDERDFVQHTQAFVAAQAQRIVRLATDAVSIRSDFL